MTSDFQKPNPSVTNQIPWGRLLGFMDWLLDQKTWPTEDGDSESSAHLIWKKVRSVRLKLEKVLKAIPLLSARLEEALELIVQVEREYYTARKLRAYRMSDFWIHYDSHGLLRRRRRVFVAKIAFELLRTSRIYKGKLAKKKDGFHNMAAYMHEKGCSIDFYDVLKQDYYRYLEECHEAPQDAIHSLYALYLLDTANEQWTGVPDGWQRRIIVRGLENPPKERYSEAEANMLKRLTELAAEARLGKPRKTKVKRS